MFSFQLWVDEPWGGIPEAAHKEAKTTQKPIWAQLG